MLVIAKAYGGEPLRRIATGHQRGLTYVVNPHVVENSDVEPLSGVGFPDSAVFRFDDNLYGEMRTAWDEGRISYLNGLWERADNLVAHD